MTDLPERPELIHLDVDRRLGHEWDEWDGRPLPNGGSFDAAPRLFFAWSLLWIVGAAVIAAFLLLLLAPRLALLAPRFPILLGWGLGGVAALCLIWWALLAMSYARGTPLLPERLAERGPLLRLMRGTSRLADRFGRRDWVENAAVKVYDAMALSRQRKVAKGELLLLIPRCLAKDILDGVLRVAGRYQIPVFVATRGQLARRVIRERRPRAVVAVACERDMVSGLHDVAGKVPVLGLTLTLPSGPCRDTRVDLGLLEEWVRAYVV
ncbi:MAG TPA: DUF116 domain-containing protein [Gemmatimonadales bacterium]|nr:DUF116 domain-containing protein [Gemmatimonadales bacterium]